MSDEYPRTVILGGLKIRVKPPLDLGLLLGSQVHPDDRLKLLASVGEHPEALEHTADFILWGRE